MPVQPAHNPQTFQSYGVAATLPFYGSNAEALNPINTNPIFRRPIWTYVQTNQAPRHGPQPRLAQGTGATGNFAAAGQSAMLPGFVVENDYRPSPFTYQPANNQDMLLEIPRTIKTGDNGRILVGTYNPHDFTPGQRFSHHLRSAANWQAMLFPPNFRNLLQWQQAQRYRIHSLTLSARPLDSSQYFLGYQINPQIGGQIGQSTLGYMGSL